MGSIHRLAPYKFEQQKTALQARLAGRYLFLAFAWLNAFARAADGNRTRDLRTTNATLYRLSHSSTMVALATTECYCIKGILLCQLKQFKIINNHYDSV